MSVLADPKTMALHPIHFCNVVKAIGGLQFVIIINRIPIIRKKLRIIVKNVATIKGST